MPQTLGQCSLERLVDGLFRHFDGGRVVSRDGVRVHCISPSYVRDTPVFEKRATSGRGEAAAQRAGLGLPTPKDIAPLVLFLCGPDAAKITGQIISVNGGLNA